MNEPYYTDAEMLQQMQQLANAGHPITAICNDPRCKPDIKEKLLRLKQLSNPSGKGAGHGQK